MPRATRSQGAPPQDQAVKIPDKPVVAPKRRGGKLVATTNNNLENVDTETSVVVAPKRSGGKVARGGKATRGGKAARGTKRSLPDTGTSNLSAPDAPLDGSGSVPDDADNDGAMGTSIIEYPEDGSQPPAPKRARNTQTAEPATRNLPARLVKPQHPGLPAAPRPKRSHEEVQKQKDRLEALKEQEKMLDEQRRKELAKLEILEKAAAEAEESTVVRTWDDVPDEDAMVVDDESPVKAAKPRQASKKRGALRRDVEALKAEMGEAEEEDHVTVLKASSAPKKIPSALVPNWKSRVAGNTGKGLATGPVSASDELDCGGLNDDDIDDRAEELIRPGANGKGKSGLRSAQLVAELPAAKPIPSTASARAQAKKLASTKNSASEGPRSRGKKVKADDDDTPIAATTSRAGSSDLAADIPAFLRSSWTTKMLPTVAHALYTSSSPFGVDFSKNSIFLELVQSCIAAVAPGTTYQAVMRGRVFERAYGFIINKRHGFIDEAREYVAHIMEPLSKAERIELVDELVQPGGGTALYQDVSGPSPKGLGESTAFSRVFGAVVKDTVQKSQYNGGLKLQGAFGLTAAALCMASQEWSTGTLIKSGSLFSNDVVGGDVREYSAKSAELTEKAWKRIHQAANTMVFGAGGVPALPAPRRLASNPLSRPLHIPTSSPDHSDQELDDGDENLGN